MSYFPIKDCPNIIFYTKEEIINCNLPDFKVIGCLSVELKKDFRLQTKDTIYVVKLLPTRFVFCVPNGKIIYNLFFL